jgi:pilus assembly protein CpaD
MMKTQKANQNVSILRLAPILGAGVMAVMLSSCGGGYAAQREAPPPNPVLEAQLNRTVLEAHTPTAVPVEARLVLPAAQGVQGLTAQEYSQLTAFANDFVRLGRGTLVISVPANAGNSANAAIVAQDAQRALYAAGVDFAKITGGAYQAGGQANAPVMLSFARFEAQRIQCQPWTTVDARKTATNMSPERFGCAQNANLAAMVADPGDLLGDRTDQSRDAQRIQVGVDKLRKGDIPQVSAAAAGGGQ